MRDEAIGSVELVDLCPVKTWQARQNLTGGPTTLSGEFDLLAFSQGELIHVRRTDAPTADVNRIPVTKGMYEQDLSFDPTEAVLAPHAACRPHRVRYGDRNCERCSRGSGHPWSRRFPSAHAARRGRGSAGRGPLL